MWNSKDVYRITQKNKNVEDSLKNTINEMIKSISNKYKDPFIYTWGFKVGNRGKQHGVFVLQNGRERWCWINTINTNSSALACLLNFINKNYKRKLYVDDFLENPIESCKYFNECIKKHPELFLPRNEVFKEMFFETQFTWNKSIISQLVILHTITKKHDIKFNIGIERGDPDDMFFGIDGVLLYSGSTGDDTVQFKNSHNGLLEFDGENYWFKYFKYYNSYRKLKKLIIDDDLKVFYFHNSQSNDLCGYSKHPSEGEKFRIHKSLLIDIMEHTDSLKIGSLLHEINQICFDKQIVFYIDTDNSGKNSIDRIIESKVDTVKFILNNPEDSDLLEIVTSFYEKFKTTP